MNLQKEFRTLILPIIKGAPIIAFFVIIAMLLAGRMVLYSVPVYSSDGSIKLDQKDFGISNFDLFNTGGGKSNNNFLTEVEVFKSKQLKDKTLAKLPEFRQNYYRVGKAKTTELYRNSPFLIDYDIKNKQIYNKEYTFTYKGDATFDIAGSGISGSESLAFGEVLNNEYFTFTLSRNDSFLLERPNALSVGDVFKFKVNSLKALAKDINATNLFIKPIDREIFIVKVYYQNEIPEKAAMLVNTLMETYIENDLETKSKQGNATLDFIDSELADVGGKLRGLEGQLASFKRDNNLMNANLETDAILKELAALDKQQLDYKIQGIELNNVYNFLRSEQKPNEFSPDFQAIKDDVFKTTYLKLQDLETQKRETLKRYTPTSSEALSINNKIRDTRDFLRETVKKKIINADAKKNEVSKTINKAQTKYQTLPDKERKIVQLQRDLAMTEQTFTFLTKKKTEVSVANSAKYSFHEIIDYASPASKPISPNKALIYGLGFFLSFLFSLIVVYIRAFFVTTITSKVQLLEKTDLPFLATIAKVSKNDLDNIEPYIQLYTNLELKFKDSTDELAKVIVLSSLGANEGKTMTTANLGKVMANYDKQVLLLDMNVHHPDLHNYFNKGNDLGVSTLLTEDIAPSEIIQKTDYPNLDLLPSGYIEDLSSTMIFSPKSQKMIQELRKYYDVILIDTPPVGRVADAVPLMHLSDINLHVIRSNHTKARRISHINKFQEEYQIPNYHLVLNGLKLKGSVYRRKDDSLWKRLGSYWPTFSLGTKK